MIPEILPEKRFVNVTPVQQDVYNQWVEALSEEDYHADGTAVSSGGVRLALQSPRAFYRAKVLGKGKPPSKAMNFGKAAHYGILEPEKFKALYRVLPDFGDMRSSTNRAKRDAWKMDCPPGSQFLTQEEHENLTEMVEAVKNYRDKKTGTNTIVKILESARFEVSGYFRDPETGLKCKIRPDILMLNGDVMPDLKTARKVDQRSFQNAIWSNRYDVQLAFYKYGIQLITGKRPEHLVFIVPQNCEPFDVAVYRLDEGALDRAEQEMKAGLRRIKQGIETGEWPGIQMEGAEDIGLPTFTDWVPVEE